MGSFDSICSVSHVPIHDGDQAIIFYVATNTGSRAYKGGQFSPIVFPLMGEYNDYGELENIDEDSLSYKFFKGIITSEFESVTLPTFRESDPIEVFKDEVHCGYQILPDKWVLQRTGNAEYTKEEPRSYAPDKEVWKLKQGNGSVVRKMFVHRKIYDHFIQLFLNGSVSWWDDTKGQDTINQIPEFVQEIKKAQDEKDDFRKKLDAMNEEEKSDFIKNDKSGMLHVYFGESLTAGDKFDDRHFLNMIFKSSSSEDRSLVWPETKRIIKKLVMHKVQEGEFDKAADIIREYVLMLAFGLILNRHNMEYSPYLGYPYNQYQEREDAVTMNNLFDVFKEVQQQAIDRWAEWDEEDGWCDDEEE